MQPAITHLNYPTDLESDLHKFFDISNISNIFEENLKIKGFLGTNSVRHVCSFRKIIELKSVFHVKEVLII